MYQFQFRPEIGFKLVAQQQPKQLGRGSRVEPCAIDSTVFFLQSFLTIFLRPRVGALALLTGCFVAVLSGCGVNYPSTASIMKTAGGNSTVALSSVSCGTQSLTGAQSKACSVYLSAAAKSPTTVLLTSSNAALTVPGAVVVPTGAKSTGFNAVTSAVSQALSVTITGKAGGITETDAITLYPEATAAAELSKVSCGTQTITGPTTRVCSVYLSVAAGSATVVALSSNNSALQVPTTVTVAAGATSAGFNATASAVSAAETVTLTASAGGVSQTDAIQLEATAASGAVQHQVQLSWDAPSSSSMPISGYMVYRATAGGASYALLTSSMDTQTSYIDTTVQGGLSYNYQVKSVDSSGVESAPSNTTTVTIP